MKNLPTATQMDFLTYALAEALTAREPLLANVSPAQLKNHEEFVKAWMTKNPDLLHQALAEGSRLGPSLTTFSTEVVCDLLLPVLIPLVGVRQAERPLYW